MYEFQDKVQREGGVVSDPRNAEISKSRKPTKRKHFIYNWGYKCTNMLLTSLYFFTVDILRIVLYLVCTHPTTSLCSSTSLSPLYPQTPSLSPDRIQKWGSLTQTEYKNWPAGLRIYKLRLNFCGDQNPKDLTYVDSASTHAQLNQDIYF